VLFTCLDDSVAQKDTRIKKSPGASLQTGRTRGVYRFDISGGNGIYFNDFAISVGEWAAQFLDIYQFIDGNEKQ
jgi:hypothetical protein